MLENVRFGPGGLIPVVIVDDRDGRVLTLAYADRVALDRTVQTHSTWLFSRSRNALWNKGATSGNTQRVVAMSVDCDGDAVIYRVIPTGPACHTGRGSCFSERLRFARSEDATVTANGQFAQTLEALAGVIAARKLAPIPESYTAGLFAGGVDRIGKKIGEEATEVVIAAKNDDRGELVWEVADLLYHTLVLLAARNVSLAEVGTELARRARPRE